MSAGLHPVWALYDMLRTARLNEKYYERILAKFERNSTICEVILLATAPSSSVAGLCFWDTTVGGIAWKLLGGIAALVAIYKPLVLSSRRLKNLEKIVYGYRMLFYDLNLLRSDVEKNKCVTDQVQRDFEKARKRERDLVSNKPERLIDRKMLHDCTNEVLAEFPLDCFYTPED